MLFLEACHRRCNTKKAFEAYCDWYASDDTHLRDLALEEALPAATYAIRLFYGRAFEDENKELIEDELLSGASFNINTLICKKKFDPKRYKLETEKDREKAAKAYQAYLITASRYGADQALRKPFNVFDYAFAQAELPCARPVTIEEVEQKMFVEELPRSIYKHVKKKLRFMDGSRREFCLFVLEKMLSGEVISEVSLKRRFRIRNQRFYIDHVSVLIRDYLYKVRKELDNRVVGDDWYNYLRIFNPWYVVDFYEADTADNEI